MRQTKQQNSRSRGFRAPHPLYSTPEICTSSFNSHGWLSQSHSKRKPCTPKFGVCVWGQKDLIIIDVIRQSHLAQAIVLGWGGGGGYPGPHNGRSGGGATSAGSCCMHKQAQTYTQAMEKCYIFLICILKAQHWVKSEMEMICLLTGTQKVPNANMFNWSDTAEAYSCCTAWTPNDVPFGMVLFGHQLKSNRRWGQIKGEGPLISQQEHENFSGVLWSQLLYFHAGHLTPGCSPTIVTTQAQGKVWTTTITTTTTKNNNTLCQ